MIVPHVILILMGDKFANFPFWSLLLYFHSIYLVAYVVYFPKLILRDYRNTATSSTVCTATTTYAVATAAISTVTATAATTTTIATYITKIATPVAPFHTRKIIFQSSILLWLSEFEKWLPYGKSTLLPSCSFLLMT